MITIHHLTKLARIAIISTIGACSTGPDSVEACSGAIQVGLRHEPLAFDWSPRCGITDLSVTAIATTAGGQDRLVWAFQVPELSPLGPTVAYGEAPSRAQVWAGPEPLVIGGRYRVTIRYVVGGDAVSASGELTFTWFPPD